MTATMTSLNLDKLCDQAFALEKAGQRERALDLYREVLDFDPKHYRTLLLGANLLTLAGRRPEASQWAERAFSADSNSFARDLLVDALAAEAMEVAASEPGTLEKHSRLLRIGARLCQLTEVERGRAVLEFVQSMAANQLASLAQVCLETLDAHGNLPVSTLMAWVNEGMDQGGVDLAPALMKELCDLRDACGIPSELMMLRVPAEHDAQVSLALGMDRQSFFALGHDVTPALKPRTAQAFTLAVEGDTLGAGTQIYEALKHSTTPEFGVYDRQASSSTVIAGLFKYPVIDFHGDSNARQASLEESLFALLQAYWAITPTPIGNLIVESIALGLSRWYGLQARYDEALQVVESALEGLPFAMHLKAAQFTIRARQRNQPIHPRLEKFVGEDSGYLKDYVCVYPFTRLDIDQKGGSRVCCGHWMPTMIGNVMEQDPLTLLNSPIAKKIKRSVMEGDYRYCNHVDCILMVSELLPTREQVGEATLAKYEKDDFTSTGIEHLLFAFDQSCNLSCPSCRTEKIVEKASLSQKKMDVIEHKIAPMLKGLKKLDINPAGELFASKLARRTLSLIKPKDNPELEIDIISNGTLFNEENWNGLANVHELIGIVRVSVDGCTKPTFEKLRRLAVWEVFIENMKFLRSLRQAGRIKSLRYSFTYQRDNFREMEDFVHFAREMGCDFVIFEKLQNMGAYRVSEYHDRAVHLPHHPLHGEYLAMIDREIFYDPSIARDFSRPERTQSMAPTTDGVTVTQEEG